MLIFIDIDAGFMFCVHHFLHFLIILLKCQISAILNGCIMYLYSKLVIVVDRTNLLNNTCTVVCHCLK